MDSSGQRAGIRLVVGLLIGLLAACGTPPPPTATPIPPTATPLPPTATPVPPTATPAPPTATPLRPTATPSPAAPVAAPTTGTKPSAPTGAATANSQLVSNVVKALDGLTSYRVEGSIESRRLGRVGILVERAAADRVRQQLKIENGTIEIIQLGADRYYNLGTGWKKAGADDPVVASLASPVDASSIVQDFSDAELSPAAAETIDGVACNVYTYTKGGETGKIWIGRSDNLVRRVEGKSDNGDYRLNLTNFNQPIEIIAPI